MGGTVRKSEIYGRARYGQEQARTPQAVNQASGPPKSDAKPAIWWAGLVGMLVAARFLWESMEGA